MKTYQIIIGLNDKTMEIDIKANNWEEVVEYVFGKIEIIDKNE